ncbi:4'-phosphopantetheinyl transferase superfamily protein [uncultured Nocardioides sp.]|uniref:4'-phosphopantetheinyl transferase family protein n=1 Tax=uncultured Nocardioides sp. TaxID=198441 RepID=UPI002625B793|nr:4'-phosphopantetheinyl transferase superfamily protein [uncultured Nocardioides sp.]
MTATVAVAHAAPELLDGLDLSLVPESEHARFAKRRREDDRLSFLAAWAVASRMVADRMETDVDQLRVVRTCIHCSSEEHGKPQFVDSGLDLSLSHTRGGVAVALGTGCEVGVDIERVPAEPWPPEMVRVVVGDDEPIPFPGQEVRVWTAKESVVKCLAVGLMAPVKDLAIAFRPEGPVVVRWDTRPDVVDDLVLRELDVPEDFSATLAVRVAGGADSLDLDYESLT